LVKFIVVANNEKDPFKRRWMLSIDNVPPPNWPLVSNFDGRSFIENHTQGEMMSTDLSLPDGKHVVYFAVSAPQDGSYGMYSGGIQMDSVSGEFNSVDVDTVAAFEIEVKGNKAVKRVGSAAQELKDTQARVMAPLAKIKAYATRNSKMLIVAVLAGAGATAGIYFFQRAKYRRRL
jgi:hypothetical protein